MSPTRYHYATLLILINMCPKFISISLFCKNIKEILLKISSESHWNLVSKLDKWKERKWNKKIHKSSEVVVRASLILGKNWPKKFSPVFLTWSSYTPLSIRSANIMVMITINMKAIKRLAWLLAYLTTCSSDFPYFLFFWRYYLITYLSF